MAIRSILAALALSLCPGMSVAQVPDEVILAFNAAVTRGEPAAVGGSAKVLADSVMEHRDDPRAALLAYEAAWALCRVGDCPAGVEAARFAASQPDTMDYPSLAERQLLTAYIDWTGKSERSTRSALDEALAAVAPMPPGTLSLKAFIERLTERLNQGHWPATRELANLAVQHLAPAKSQIPETYVEIALIEQMADFQIRKDPDAEVALAHLQGELASLMQGQGSEAIETAEALRWRIEAWRAALHAYFYSNAGERIPSENVLDGILAQYPEYPSDTGQDDDADEPELCAGHLNMSPRMRYPVMQMYKGGVGAVYTRITLEDGKVEEVEILASVPQEGFAEQARETILKWRWVVDEDLAEPGCGLSRSNLIVPIVYSIE